MELPTIMPSEAPKGLEELQRSLMCIAEDRFGKREPPIIMPPRFAKQEQPDIYFFHNDKEYPEQVIFSAFARLTPICKKSWPHALFQLSHETVHLLNPRKQGTANYLEEGIAVFFSLVIQALYSILATSFVSVSDPKYVKALSMVLALPGHPFAYVKTLRQRAGALSNVSPNHLLELFPNMDPTLADSLCRKFSIASSVQENSQ